MYTTEELIEKAKSFGSTVAEQIRVKKPYLENFRIGEFEPGKGVVRTSKLYLKPEDDSWDNEVPSSTTYEYQLFQKALNSHSLIDADDDQVDAAFGRLVDHVSDEISARIVDSSIEVFVKASIVGGEVSVGAVKPDSYLSAKNLLDLKAIIENDGGKDIVLHIPITEWGKLSEGDRLQLNQAFLNVHVLLDLPMYDESLNRVPFYVADEASNGTRLLINDKYIRSPFSSAQVFAKDAVEIQTPIHNLSETEREDFKRDPLQYLASDCRYLNIPKMPESEDGRPDLKCFRSTLQMATRPVQPRLGYNILFRNKSKSLLGDDSGA